MPRARVIVTRAEPGATRTCQALDALGFDAINAASAIIEPVEARLELQPGEALALTSPNGAEALARLTNRRDCGVFCVGDATAQAARASGFTNVHSAKGDGPALAQLIIAHRPPCVLHVRGQDQAFDLVAALTAIGIKARDLIAYRARPVLNLPECAREALADGGVVLIHSAQGATRFIRLCEGEALEGVRLIAISERAAAPLDAAGLPDVTLADHPTETGLIDALRKRMQS